MKINMRSIPHNQQRYPTLGDYWYDSRDGSHQIRTTQFHDWRYEFLILLHEQVEYMLCLHRGIREESVKAFDEAFEAAGSPGEPGDARDAPYYKEHQFAQAMEMMMAQELGVNWHEYGRTQDRVWEENQLTGSGK